MLNRNLEHKRFADADSAWVRSFSLDAIKCLVVCRGPVRKEAIDVFEQVGLMEYGILLSEKDSVVYPRCYAPELRDFRYRNNIHRVADYMGVGAEERAERIREIIDIAVSNNYTHVFAGYGFMAEDAEFIEAIEDAGLNFVGPSSRVARRAGAKDEAKKLARSLHASVTPGVDNITSLTLLRRVDDRSGLEAVAAQQDLPWRWDGQLSLEDNADALLNVSYAKKREVVTVAELQAEATTQAEQIWQDNPGRRLRLKHIGGGGGKGQRIVSSPDEVAAAVMEVLAESKAVEPGSNRNFLMELNIEHTRHNEIQLYGNGTWAISLGGRDCSVQMHEQKLLELSLTRELLEHEIDDCRQIDPHRASVLEGDKRVLNEMEVEAERFGEAVGLDSVSTFESIVDGKNHYFMEMNTRIQVEHRVTEMVYRLKFANPADGDDFFYVESLIEAMLLAAQHGKRLPRPERVVRHCAGSEVRINATNQALQPHAGGIIYTWSPPLEGELRDDQGIGTLNPDTDQFVWYNIAGAYDSNIALVVTHGSTRRDNLIRLAELLRRTEMRGENLQTNMQMHFGLLNFIIGTDPMLKPSTRFMGGYLAAVGALQQTINEVDLGYAWQQELAKVSGAAREFLSAKQTLILRPIERLFENPHMLAGFLARYEDKLWRRVAGGVVFKANPVVFLDRLYRYLHLEWQQGKAASEMIWAHDQQMLETGYSFYNRCAERTSTEDDWPALDALLNKAEPDFSIVGEDAALWERCQASHQGFQLGMELLLMIPRAGERAGFFGIHVDRDLQPVFPLRFTEAKTNEELTRALAPPPKASADEIVSPMGGHFYAREAPDLPPLVQVGDHFDVGQPLFIVEVMKMFNKVRAPFSGTVVENLMDNADGRIIAKGQRIFRIEPDERMEEETDEQIARRRRAATDALLGLPN
jgi:acetyl/propionyl-CoA carboxylase alpha subunit